MAILDVDVTEIVQILKAPAAAIENDCTGVVLCTLLLVHGRVNVHSSVCLRCDISEAANQISSWVLEG